MADKNSPSVLESQTSLRWGFLEERVEACAVVSSRMELVYMNESARRLVPVEWFGKRCFEVFPSADKLCAFHCPTISAVNQSKETLFCEEVLRGSGGTILRLGVAVIPLEGAGDDHAQSLLLMQPQEIAEKEVLAEAARLKADVQARFV